MLQLVLGDTAQGKGTPASPFMGAGHKTQGSCVCRRGCPWVGPGPEWPWAASPRK